MQRYGSVIGLNDARKAEYIRLRAAFWPEIIAMISACHICNYTLHPACAPLLPTAS